MILYHLKPHQNIGYWLPICLLVDVIYFYNVVLYK